MITLALKFLIAHVVGDFVLQPDKWVRDKELRKIKSPYLYYHIVVHLLSLLVLFRFEWKYLPVLLIIVISHFIIDLIKLYLKGTINAKLLFLVDQLLHIIVIGLVVFYYEPYKIDIDLLFSEKSLILIFAVLCVTFVSSIIMKMIMNKWVLTEDSSGDSLEDAGKYIGLIERILVFVFIVIGQWAAIGLLIAAKSIFRFSDLSRAKDRKLTEYMLIGSLISFGLAILIGLAYNYTISL